MDALNFSLGIKTFEVNGAHTVAYNPTDVNFVGPLYDLFVALSDRYEEDKDKEFADNKAFFGLTRERDHEIVTGIDAIFGAGTADALFQGISPRAFADGLPLWTNFLLSVIETVPEEMSRQVKASRPRVDKYLKKYHR